MIGANIPDRVGPALGACLCGIVVLLTGLLGPARAHAAQFGSQGHGPGQFEGPAGVAIDQAIGDVYVPDVFNYRVDEFDSSGAFLKAWGWNVDPNTPANELQTCTTASGCSNGNFGAGAGEFETYGASGVAVDNNEPFADISAGDVYVLDWENFRIQKFDPEGKFLLMFGGGVNETTGNDVCASGEACGRGTSGAGNGQFEWAYQNDGIIAVGPGGDVYVGDKARVEVFEPSGAWLENVSLTGLSAEGKVTSLAVNSSGDIFVKVEGVPGVHELEPSGVEVAVKLDERSEAVEAITCDAAGDLFVADSSGGFHILKYDASGQHVDTFGTNTATETTGIALSESSHELYIAGYFESVIWTVPEPTAAGPWIEPGSEAVTPEVRGGATFAATVNPEGSDASYHFEYVTDAQFKAGGFAGATSTPTTSVGSPSEDFEDHRVEAMLLAKTLAPGTTYHWRTVAGDTEGHTTIGATQTFEEPPAARIEGPWAANVTATSTSLAAQIDPLSSNTNYRLEWGKTTGYGHVFNGNVGEGLGYVPVGPFHIQELEPHTTYHYRLVTTNEMGTIEGEDHTFTTQIAANAPTLPDGRGWELVSPPDKKAALIQPNLLGDYPIIQAAADGSAIAYDAGDVIGEGASGKGVEAPLISRLTPSGWRTTDIAVPYALPPEGTNAAEDVVLGTPQELFSSDLALTASEQQENPAPPLSEESKERTPYLRDNLQCESQLLLAQPLRCYTALVNAGNVEPSGAAYGGKGSSAEAILTIAGATPDLSHIVLRSSLALVKGAVAELRETIGREGPEITGPPNLYEWSGGQLQLVNVLPNETSHPNAILGYLGSNSKEVATNAISRNGRRIVWSYGNTEFGIELYDRDLVAKKTIKLGKIGAHFQTMSSDGSRIFYLEGGELYEVDFDTGAQTDLTSDHGSGEASAGVQDALLGASEDGSYLYFVATGVLGGSAAPRGGHNLYVMHLTSEGWQTTYIATLALEDEPSWFASGAVFAREDHCDCGGIDRNGVTSRVSPNGQFVSFMSERPLTGYDNTDAISGQPDEEVYLYDAVSSTLVCVSCNPTGARPIGVLDGEKNLLVDPERAWASTGVEQETESHWIAGITPSWNRQLIGWASTNYYQPRFLLDNGRTFFDSPDALVPQATNGLMNVYEYEPLGVGDCSTASGTYAEHADGCINLLSAGTATTESMFYDASESGNDVFLITTARLTGEDYDASYDLYDAHVCSPGAPCPTVTPTPPPCTSGDACKAAPSAQPAVFGAPASATFVGTGNAASHATTPPKRRPARCHKGEVRKHGRCVRKKQKRHRRRHSSRRRRVVKGTGRSK